MTNTFNNAELYEKINSLGQKTFEFMCQNLRDEENYSKIPVILGACIGIVNTMVKEIIQMFETQEMAKEEVEKCLAFISKITAENAKKYLNERFPDGL